RSSPGPEQPAASSSTLRRYLEVGAVVIAWTTMGWWLDLNRDTFLLAGIPITVIFQLVIRRRPLRALWVREAPPLKLDAKGKTLASALALLPALNLLQSVVPKFDALDSVYFISSMLGAGAAAYALRSLR